MLAELGSSLWLVASFDQSRIANTVRVALVIAIWISTFALQAHYHCKLQQNSSRRLTARLIATNWIRTLLWTAKTGCSAYILAKLITI